MAAINLSKIRSHLAALNGEEVAPSSAARDVFINQAIEDITLEQQWSWRRKSTSLTFSSYQSTLPTDWVEDSFYDMRITSSGAGNDHIYTLIDESSSDEYQAGDYVCWVTGNVVDGFTMNIKEDVTPITLKYFAGPDELTTSTQTTKIPMIEPIALGAYMKLVRFDDPERSMREELVLYRSSMARMRAAYNRKASKRAVSHSERAGTYLGDVR